MSLPEICGRTSTWSMASRRPEYSCQSVMVWLTTFATSTVTAACAFVSCVALASAFLCKNIKLPPVAKIATSTADSVNCLREIDMKSSYFYSYTCLTTNTYRMGETGEVKKSELKCL